VSKNIGKKRRRLEDLLASFEECEHKWLSEVGESAQRRYPLYWQQFKDWLVAEGFDWGSKGSEIRRRRSDDLMLRRENPKRWRFEDLAKKYYKSLYENRRPQNPTSTDAIKLQVVQSFFAHQRMGLEFKRKELKQGRPIRKYYDYTLADLEVASKYATPKERWIFLGAKSLGQRVKVFSQILRKDIEPLLSEMPPVPFDVITEKVSGLVAHPCLDRDAIKAAREWLATRTDGNPYVLPSQTIVDGKSMTPKAINDAIRRVAEMCHKINPTTFKYQERGENLRFHNFRKFLTTALKNAKVDEDFQDYIVGHKQSGTKRAYTSDQRIKAYEYAEAYLLLRAEQDLAKRVTELEDIVGGREALDELKKRGFKITDAFTGTPMRRKEHVTEPEEFEALKKAKERKIIEEKDAENALNHGWNPVMVFPSGKILIERQA